MRNLNSKVSKKRNQGKQEGRCEEMTKSYPGFLHSRRCVTGSLMRLHLGAMSASTPELFYEQTSTFGTMT